MTKRSSLVSLGEKIVDASGGALLNLVEKFQALSRPDPTTVGSLPASGRIGETRYCTDLRVFNGTGTRETAGNGTGGSVEWNGAHWVITGTNVTAAA